MLISMGMDSGRIAKSQWDDDSSQEIVRVEWNPVQASLPEVAMETAGRAVQRHDMPTSMVEVDVDAFLRKMYAAPR